MHLLQLYNVVIMQKDIHHYFSKPVLGVALEFQTVIAR